jgi:hypothetical protein
MTHHTPFTARRAIYDDDLRVRLDAAMARAQRFLDSTRPVRAKTFTPFCMGCQQAGRKHDSPLTAEQHYICAHCHRRWVTQPSAS